MKTIWQTFKFRKHCWHLWLKNIAEECWTFFWVGNFFYKKTSLCLQIAKLKLPTCGQGLTVICGLKMSLTTFAHLPNWNNELNWGNLFSAQHIFMATAEHAIHWNLASTTTRQSHLTKLKGVWVHKRTYFHWPKLLIWFQSWAL